MMRTWIGPVTGILSEVRKIFSELLAQNGFSKKSGLWSAQCASIHNLLYWVFTVEAIDLEALD